MQSRIDLTWFISGNDHVNVCANYQSDWSTFVSDFGEELFLDLENAYSRGGWPPLSLASRRLAPPEIITTKSRFPTKWTLAPPQIRAGPPSWPPLRKKPSKTLVQSYVYFCRRLSVFGGKSIKIHTMTILDGPEYGF